MDMPDSPTLVTRTDSVRAFYADRAVTIDRLIEHGDVVLVLLTLRDGRCAVELARIDDDGAVSTTSVA